jgi:nucleoside-diphosphate-sugar epimerase
VVGDIVKQTPETTYGTTKAIGELLVNDMSRRGFIDGRSARLPTVIIRPGKPNKAASSFASGVFREPLAGVDCLVPVAAGTVLPVSGYRTVVDNFVALSEVPASELGHDRAVTFPAIDASVAQMIDSLKRVAKGRKLGAIRFEPDPLIERIVATWPASSEFGRGLELGLKADPDLDSIVSAYIEDYV